MATTLDLFSETTRAKGDDLYLDGAVFLTSSGRGRGTMLVAKVDDGERQQVILRRSGSNISMSCSCLALDSTQACAHIWAALLEANEDAGTRRWLKESFAPTLLRTLDGIENRDAARSTRPASLPSSPDRTKPATKNDPPTKPDSSVRRRQSGTPRKSSPGTQRRQPAPTPPPPPRWKSKLHNVEIEISLQRTWHQRKDPGPASTRPLRVAYFVTPSSRANFPVEVEVVASRLTQNGQWGKRRSMPISHDDIDTVESEEDATTLRRFLAVQDWRVQDYGGARTRFLLRAELLRELAPSWSARGVLLGPALLEESPRGLRSFGSAGHSSFGSTSHSRRDVDPARAIPLQWDAGGPWRLEMALHDSDGAGEKHLQASLRLARGEDRLSLAAAELFVRDFAIVGDHLLEIEGEELRPWARTFEEPLEIPKDDANEFLASTVLLPGCPVFDAPEELRWSEIPDAPVPHLHICGPDEIPEPLLPNFSGYQYYVQEPARVGRRELAARLEFSYDGILVDERSTQPRIVDKDRRAVVVRHAFSEATALRTLTDLGVRKRQSGREHFFVLNEAKLPQIVSALVDRGWQVWAKDAVIRTPQSVQTHVSSGLDWFSVGASVSYDGDTTVDLAAILAALKKGERTVRLGDGTLGVLPEEWLARNGLLLDVGRLVKGELRFGEHQAPLLDALLANQPEVEVDEQFDRVRKELRSFDGVRSVAPPSTFRATMREYQQASLGWFQFLRQFGFGGCLADDMGLGKTIMALALLDSRRTPKSQLDDRRSRRTPAAAQDGSGKGGLRSTGGSDSSESAAPEYRPSLVVVPRSLAFNWLLEAKKFAPQLRFHDHSGIGRKSLAEVLVKDPPHVILTTYGILRRDIEQFQQAHFDYAILDESQAIKNHRTSTSKAVRLLNARHRLALSGTPIENHVGELWSLFAFLNPGLLGSSQRFYKWATMPATKGPDSREGQPNASNLLAAAVRPFVLRRTKAQVAKQLPEKVEQTVYCTLDKTQRTLYETLRAHYAALLLSAGTSGVAGGSEGEKQQNKALLVLEGLLRLRQAACHPGLVDAAQSDGRSAKLDLLVERLLELKEEGHKALVFSQFVSLLSLVRKRLDTAGIRYEYLDGKTRNRAAKVDRFQSATDLDVFLISLKAGGTGLNLTAATYVFLLDPWWNPAVEAQAIDRVHRIGQTESVLACRLVARDTVEERILELQERKRDLANSIIQADAGLLKSLEPEDLAFLLRE